MKDGLFDLDKDALDPTAFQFDGMLGAESVNDQTVAGCALWHGAAVHVILSTVRPRGLRKVIFRPRCSQTSRSPMCPASS